MNNIDLLQDSMQGEMMLQSLYNKYMMEINNPEVRQLFTQLRDTKMKDISQLQQEIKTMRDQDKNNR